MLRYSKIRLVLVVALLLGVAGAKVHPVPLAENIDGAKCLECHEDKTKGESVHAAVQMGCLTCHEVRVIKSKDKKKEDITRVKLIKPTSQLQCLTCHEDKKTGSGNSVVHAPVTRNCLTCHDPHNSTNKKLLKKTASGDGDKNLCLQCHSQGMNVPEKGSRHAALDMGCDTCHVTHKTGEADKRDNRFHLTKDAPAICLDCHDANDEKLKKAHHGQPFATADCLTCHEAHASAKPKLAQRFLHAPFESGTCEACHSDAKDGKVVLTQTDTRALCVTCHGEQAEQIEKAKVQHAGAQGECVVCHSPHAGKNVMMLRPDPVKACESCHTDQAELHKSKKFLHPAAFRDGCYTCHDGHGGDRPKLLRAEGNGLCLECHSPRRSAKLDKATGVATIFKGTVQVPGSYFFRLPTLDLNGSDSFGHPIGNHPVTAAVDRSDPDKKRAMTCLSCHASHASNSRGMLVTDNDADAMALCNRCHADANGLVLPTPSASSGNAVQAQPQKPAGKKGKAN